MLFGLGRRHIDVDDRKLPRLVRYAHGGRQLDGTMSRLGGDLECRSVRLVRRAQWDVQRDGAMPDRGSRGTMRRRSDAWVDCGIRLLRSSIHGVLRGSRLQRSRRSVLYRFRSRRRGRRRRRVERGRRRVFAVSAGVPPRLRMRDDVRRNAREQRLLPVPGRKDRRDYVWTGGLASGGTAGAGALSYMPRALFAAKRMLVPMALPSSKS